MEYYSKYIRPTIYILLIVVASVGLITGNEKQYIFGNKYINVFFIVFALVILVMNYLRMKKQIK